MTALPPPPAHVWEAFATEGAINRFTGGQGTSWLSGRVVLKPGDEVFQQWLGETLAGRVFDGIRVPRPLPSRRGAWVVDGWTATEFVAGDTPDLAAPSTWSRVIAAGRRFHDALADVPPPAFHADRTDPWGGWPTGWLGARAP